MSDSLHDQAERIRYVPNPVYDRLAEIAWEYIGEQTVADLSCERIVRRDLAKLFAQVDRHMTPDDEDDDETVDLGAMLPAAMSDSEVYQAMMAPAPMIGGGV